MSGTFVMPSIGICRYVNYYRGNVRSKPIPGLVIEVGDSTISVRTFGRGAVSDVFDGVHHVDDPVLNENPYVAQRGSWDFTDDDKHLMNLHKLTNSRLAEMERRLRDAETTAQMALSVANRKTAGKPAKDD